METKPKSNATLQRAQERVARISEAQTERDADHFESEAMGYLSALRDVQALAGAEFSQLMNELTQKRMSWRKPADCA